MSETVKELQAQLASARRDIAALLGLLSAIAVACDMPTAVDGQENIERWQRVTRMDTISIYAGASTKYPQEHLSHFGTNGAHAITELTAKPLRYEPC